MRAKTTNNDRHLLKVKDVAERLSMSKAWVRDHATGRRKPQLPCIRLGDRRRQLRFDSEAIDKFLQENTRNA